MFRADEIASVMFLMRALYFCLNKCAHLPFPLRLHGTRSESSLVQECQNLSFRDRAPRDLSLSQRCQQLSAGEGTVFRHNLLSAFVLYFSRPLPRLPPCPFHLHFFTLGCTGSHSHHLSLPPSIVLFVVQCVVFSHLHQRIHNSLHSCVHCLN